MSYFNDLESNPACQFHDRGHRDYPGKSLARIFLTLGLLAVLLTGCSGSALVPPPPAPLTPTLTPFAPVTATLTLSPEPTDAITATPTASPLPPIRRVLLITVDGLRPDAIDLAPMPVLQGLIAEGAYTLTAQTILPSSTLPSHASMIIGLCPDKTGVDWNDYDPERGFAQGVSIFEAAHQAGLKTVMLYGKKKFSQLTLPENLDISEYIAPPDAPADPAIGKRAAEVLSAGFDLALVHFPDTDSMGHSYGWLSPNQLASLRRTDQSIGGLLAALDAAGLRQGTLVIITADHGGHDTTHGSDLPEDTTIPWITVWAGVTPQEISIPVNTTDTAATILWALRLPRPADMVGLPVTEAFGDPPTFRLPNRCP